MPGPRGQQLGKGTLTLNPYHSDCMLMSPVVVAGLLTVAVSMLDLNNSMHWGWRAGEERGIGLVMWFCFITVILGDPSYMLFYLTPAIQPRMLVTFNADLEPLMVTVKVGQVGV